MKTLIIGIVKTIIITTIGGLILVALMVYFSDGQKFCRAGEVMLKGPDGLVCIEGHKL